MSIQATDIIPPDTASVFYSPILKNSLPTVIMAFFLQSKPDDDNCLQI